MDEEHLRIVESENPYLPPAETHSDEFSHGEQPYLPVPEESTGTEKSYGGSIDRDVALAGLEKDKRSSLIRAWEERERSRAENKAHKRAASIGTWENSKKASIDARLRKFEEKIQRKKAAYAEKMQNKIAEIHKGGEEKRAGIEAKRGEDLLKVDETSAKFRAMGNVPKKSLGCFG